MGATARRSAPGRWGRGDRRARRRSGPPCGCRDRRSRRTSGRARWKIRNISAVQRPDPLDLGQHRDHVLVGELAQPIEVEAPVLDPLRQVLEEAHLGPGEPGVAQLGAVDLEQLRGRGGVAAEQLGHPAPDRGGGLGGELLADDRPGQRLVGVGPAAAAIGLRVDRPPLVDQPPKDVVDGARCWSAPGAELRRAGSGSRARGRRRSTSSPGRSPCRSARARGGGW